MRKLNDWLESYLQYTENHEAPEKLHWWTGLSVLSAALRRRIWLNRGRQGRYLLYPNLYVIFVAPSALVMKSAAIKIGIELLMEAVPGVLIMQDRMTPEGLVKHLNRTTITEQRIITKDSHVFIFADELANLFGYDKQTASRMAILLTRTYECPKRYEHTTSGEGQSIIYNAYPTLLAATDPVNLKVLPPDAVGGLIGRLIFVNETTARKRVAWPDDGGTCASLEEPLLHDLREIATLEGEMIVTPAGRKRFAEWYESEEHIRTDSDPQLGAFRARCHDTALKVAMLISVARSGDLILDAPHVLGGIEFIERQIAETATALMWTGSTNYEQLRARFLNTLKRKGRPMTRSAMLRALVVSASELDEVEKTVIQEGSVGQRQVGKSLYYFLRTIELEKEVES